MPATTNPSPQIQTESSSDSRCEALFSVARAISAHRDPKKLFSVLAGELRNVFDFRFLSILLYDESTDAFTLLDWRQDFGGQVDYGDLYYDFAKLYGGIFLNYDYIKLNLLTYSESGEDIHFDFAQRFQTGAYLRLLSEHLRDRGYDVSRVKIIVALIYLNRSPLHHYPFDKMLYSLGRELLHAEVGNETEPAAGSS